MPLDLAALLDPKHTALVTQEVQRGVVGDLSQLPDLAEAAAPILPNIGRLAAAARAAGVPVIHCTAERRADGLGGNSNARIFQYMAKAPVTLTPGSDAAAIVPEVPVEESDLVLPRLHGLSPFQGTELDFILRNLGVTTIVGTGVSVNVAITNLSLDAVNAGYQVVIPRDAVAGFPAEYVDMVFQHTLGAVSTILDTDTVAKAWGA
ncbi:MAG: cysteine hydrolase [Deltaproteobacteria bacterium]|nr:cysteine hydrolase [Deltaproteobacteria bacterium]MBW2445565.1 cysteine hydrolase [Deltaproteobacteria bacterium]